MLDLAIQRRAAAGWAAPVFRVYDDRLSAPPGKPRRDQVEEPRSVRRPGSPPQLSCDRDRPAHNRRRPKAVPADLGEPADAKLHRGGIPTWPGGRERRGI